MDRDRGTEGGIERQHPGQGEREMDREMDRDRNGGTYKQGQRQMDRNRKQSDRARCTGTKGYEQGRGRWIGTNTGKATE